MNLPTTTGLTVAPGLQCRTGTVTLFRFIVQPQPGSIIGQLTPVVGNPIPLIQTEPTPLGGIPLSAVDGQFALLCGVFTVRGGQTVLDVRVVNPGGPSPTGTPTPTNEQLLMLILMLLSRRGFLGFNPVPFPMPSATGQRSL